jgi:hypothetical protein
MGADVSESIFRVYSSDPDNKQWGTAFAFDWSWESPNYYLSFASREEATYLLTTKHVIKDVGGAEQVRVGRYPGYPAKLLFSEPDDSPDNLVVLRLDDLRNVSPLMLKVFSESDDTVKVFGFRAFSEDFLVRPLQARLGEQIRLESRQQPRRVNGWDLRIEGDYDLERGYSGGPVIDQKSGYVVAVASHREGGRKGVAISTSTLEEGWPKVIDNAGFSAVELFRDNLAARFVSRFVQWEKSGSELVIASVHDVYTPTKLVDARTLKLFEVSSRARFSAISSITPPPDSFNISVVGFPYGNHFIFAVIEADNLGTKEVDALLSKLLSNINVLGYKGSVFTVKGSIVLHVYFLFQRGCSPEMLRFISKRARKEGGYTGFRTGLTWSRFKGLDVVCSVVDFRERRVREYRQNVETGHPNLEAGLKNLLSRYPLR